MNEQTIQAIWQITLIVASIVGAAIWLRSQLVKQRTQELEDLVETRGLKINDLEEEMICLREDMQEMRGEMRFLRELKTTEIAEATAKQVVSDLLPFLKKA